MVQSLKAYSKKPVEDTGNGICLRDDQNGEKGNI